MATPGDVDQVRRNTNVSEDDAVHTFALIESYVDEFGVSGASAKIWLEKAATYADLVDVSEAGATERLGQLKDQAMEMALHWTQLTAVATGTGSNRAKTHALERS